MLVRNIQCPRCGQEHKELDATQFDQGREVRTGGTVYDYWAKCPDADDPILIRVEKVL